MLAYFYYCQPTLEGQYVTLQQLVDEVHSLNEIFIFTQVQDGETTVSTHLNRLIVDKSLQ